MRKYAIRSQIKSDSEAASKLSASARASYSAEFRATVDRGGIYLFTASERSKVD